MHTTTRTPRHPQHPRMPLARGLISLCALLLLALAACGTTATGGGSSQLVKLTVFAAASLQKSFTEIGATYSKAHSNVTVIFNFAGSDALAKQITQGAPADVFASANAAQMDVAVKAGDMVGGGVKTFAHNRLVLIYPTANPAHIQTLQDIGQPGVKVDLAANTVPVGQYALTFLDQASADPAFGATYKDHVLKNVVSYETDVKSVLAKVALGEVDAGIVYTTDAATETGKVGTVAIPDALNSIATYPIGVVNASKNAAIARDFLAYVVSSDGQAILAKYGFLAGSNGKQYTPASS
jgi:molybdate transport system substrate-binding protein